MDGEADLSTTSLDQALFWSTPHAEILAMDEQLIALYSPPGAPCVARDCLTVMTVFRDDGGRQGRWPKRADGSHAVPADGTLTYASTQACGDAAEPRGGP